MDSDPERRIVGTPGPAQDEPVEADEVTDPAKDDGDEGWSSEGGATPDGPATATGADD